MNRFAAKLAEMRGDMIEWAPGEVRGVVHGSLPNKSNSRRLFMQRGKLRSIKEQAALDWLARFDVAARAGYQSSPKGQQLLHMLAPAMETRWSLAAVVYYPDMRRDLDIELLCDALQKSGVIANDRAIWRKESERRIDKERPRVEFALRPIHEEAPLFQGKQDGRAQGE
jgi:Holliday junction resolvase RusA-like endonuclease